MVSNGNRLDGARMRAELSAFLGAYLDDPTLGWPLRNTPGGAPDRRWSRVRELYWLDLLHRLSSSHHCEKIGAGTATPAGAAPPVLAR